ncbi:MAG: HdeD family acid-resistance protein [Streptosporangiaceae bacterium]
MSVRSSSRVESGPAQVAKRLTGPWWAYLLAGIAWVIISVIILRFNIASVATIGLLLGALFLLSAVEEFVIAAVRPNWGWAHALLGLLFIGGAIWAFVTPYGAFWALASVLGILLVVAGTIHIITAIYSKVFNDAWWFGVIGGLLEVFIGFWVGAQSFRAQAFFLIIWAGLLALFRGIFEIVLAFEMRSAQSQLDRAAPRRATANR